MTNTLETMRLIIDSHTEGYNQAIEDVITKLEADKQNLFVHNADKSLCEDVIDLNIMAIKELKK